MNIRWVNSVIPVIGLVHSKFQNNRKTVSSYLFHITSELHVASLFAFNSKVIIVTVCSSLEGMEDGFSCVLIIQYFKTLDWLRSVDSPEFNSKATEILWDSASRTMIRNNNITVLLYNSGFCGDFLEVSFEDKEYVKNSHLGQLNREEGVLNRQKHRKH